MKHQSVASGTGEVRPLLVHVEEVPVRALQADPAIVLWTHWEWRCECTLDGGLRLLHNADVYGQELVADECARQLISHRWRATVESLTLYVR